MSQKWNLQDIRPAEPRRRRTSQALPDRQPQQPQDTATHSSNDEGIVIRDNRKKNRQLLVWLVATVTVIVVGIVTLGLLLQGADVSVFPRTEQRTLNATITAYPEPRPGELSYEIITLTAESERQVSATGQEEAEERASGMIEIINTNQQPQQLVANTRFRSPDGLIYRIAEGVTVPGAMQDGDGTIPGSITVTVTADEPGPEYNISDSVRFDIPGFAEAGLSDLFERVYAENRDQITGGFLGTRFAIDEDERRTARQALQLELRNQLLERVDTERPAEFVLYQDSVTFTYEELPAVEYGSDLVTIKESATLLAPLFDHHQLARYLAEQTVVGYSGEPVRVDNLTDMSFSYQNGTSAQTPDLRQATSLTFNLTGRPLFVWTFDEDDFIEQLSGLPRGSLENLLEAFPGIRRAEARIQPFWQQSFPSDPETISIREVIEE